MNTESPFAHRIARSTKKPAKTPTISPDPESPAPTAPVPDLKPAGAPSALRQAMIVLAAFVITTLVLMIFAVAWKIILAK